MKVLVAYYSRTGNTKQLALDIAKELKADTDEIIDLKSRRGIFGFFSGGKDAVKKNLTKIESKKDSSKYDVLVIGTPVWAGNMTPAVRTYLTKRKAKKVAFFCSSGSGNPSKTFEEMANLAGKPLVTLSIKKKGPADIKEFIKAIVKFKKDI